MMRMWRFYHVQKILTYEARKRQRIALFGVGLFLGLRVRNAYLLRTAGSHKLELGEEAGHFIFIYCTVDFIEHGHGGNVLSTAKVSPLLLYIDQ